MRIYKIITFTISVFLIIISCSQDNDTYIDNSKISITNYDSQTVENLAVLCKVWGFLKYYHPEVAKGKYNWDFELFKVMPSILKSKSDANRNKILYKWIRALGEIEQSGENAKFDPDSVKIYPDLKWIEDKTLLGDKLANELDRIKNAKREDSHHYVEFALCPLFKKEMAYDNLSFPDVGYRLLALYRYWNIIQYYFPYRYLIENWHGVLHQFIPQFINASDELEYQLALLRLITRINDTHAKIGGSRSQIISNFKGENIVPVRIQFIEERPVVVEHFSSHYKIPLKIGDILLSVNNIPIDSIIKSKRNYIPASNEPSFLRNVAYELLRTNSDKLLVEYEQDNKIYRDTLACYPVKTIGIGYISQRPQPLVKTLNTNITYLYLGSTLGGEIPNIKTKNLIIDLRCYPSGGVKGYWEFEQLYPQSVPFATPTYGSIIYPGMFIFNSPEKTEYNASNYFRGKTVVLINEISQSASEFLAMKYRSAPNVTLVGSVTAGADGNASQIPLPGGIYTIISGVGIYYPDGTETQQVGIVPDIEVKPTITGIIEGRDEVLEKAIEFLSSKKGNINE